MWGFNRDDAKSRGYKGAGFEEWVVVDADAIQPARVERLLDDLGEFTSLVGVGATFQVDLIEPGRYDLRHKLVPNPGNILVEKLVEVTFPWCITTISAAP